LCKVYKQSEMTAYKANPYIFKGFNTSVAQNVKKCEDFERESVRFEKSDNDYNNIEILKQKIRSLEVKAESIVKNAETEAGKIVEAANSKAICILNSSSAEGYKKGVAAANEKYNEVICNLNLKAGEILKDTKQSAEKIIDDLENEILDFSFDIARKILDVEMDRNDDVFTKIINKAVLGLKANTVSKIMMQEEDLKRLEKHGFDNALIDSGRSKPELIYNSDLKPGDIIIETDRGIIDAGINAQFARIRSELADE
jgi:flagellar assembly protein FliH